MRSHFDRPGLSRFAFLRKRLLPTAPLTTPLLLLLLAGPATARENALEAGSWSFQFGIAENFRVTTFEGALLSMKHHLTDRSALRFGLDLTLESEEAENSGSNWGDDSLMARSRRDSEADSRSIGVRMTYLYHPRPSSTPSFYFGLGPAFTYRSGDRELVNVSSDGGRTTSAVEHKSWSVGALATLGAEYFVTSRFSMHGEYHLFGGYMKASEDREERALDDQRRNFSTTEIRRWLINDRGALVGLSVYF